ncbi:MAG: tetratricopeptide repeat protein [Candidatus Latescibacteria bacterium]|nr:tetratricopeptide repeat protein [Candidatus Latescibacterota bacterium]
MKSTKYILAGLVALIVMASPPSEILAQGMQVTSAKVYIKQNEFDKAEALLTEALEKDSEHKDANFYMGYVRYTQGRYGDLLTHWGKFEQKKLGRRERDMHKKVVKDLYQNAFNKGVEAYNAQDWPTATSMFRVAADPLIKKDPRDFQPETMLGFTLVTSDQIDEGIVVLEKVVKTDPSNLGVWNGLLNGYIKNNDHPNIIRAYENYMPLSDQVDANDYYRLGRSHAVLGDTLKAAEVYEAGAKAVPDEMNFYLMSSEIHVQFNDIPKAAEMLENARKIDPVDLKILNNLGILYYNMKEYAKAIEPLEMLVEVEPLSIDGWQNLGDAHFGLAKVAREAGDTEKATEYSTKGTEYEDKSKALMRSGEGK